MLNRAVIDLRKIKSNALNIKKFLPPSVKFCAVVKADAYGHGAEEVANYIYTLVDYYAVALVEEGIALRLSAIDKPILVFSKSFKLDVENALRYDLTLTITCFNDIVRLNNIAKKHNKRLSVHIKFNTGMNRCGVDSISDIKKILRYAKNSNIDIDGLYSHYACAENDKELKRATDKFLVANNLVKSYNNNAICHISASGGFLKGQYFDMVRIGILLYGYKPFNSDKIQVKPAMKVYAKVVANRKLFRGEHLLYGTSKLYHKEDISLIRFGYADGLFRTKLHGDLANRCMDISAVRKVTSSRQIKVLDNADTLAKKYKTISYEILVCASKRAEKIYIR